MINRIAEPFLALPRPAKRLLALGVDALLCALTVWLALSLRMENWVVMHGNQWLAIVLSLALALPVFVMFGLYRAIFRYAGLAALLAVTKAVLVYGLLYAALLTVLELPEVPRTVGMIQPIFLLLAVGTSRALARFWLSGEYVSRLNRGNLPKVLIYGAGSAGRQLAGAMASSLEMHAVGFLDDDRHLHGRELNGLRIYNPAQLPQLVTRLQVSDVLLAMPSANRQRRKDILKLTRQAHVAVRTLPGLMDLAQGHVLVSDLREIDIEDLLGRDAVPPDASLFDKKIAGKVVLVTGAGGSIGSELCHQIIRLAPSKLLLVELSELALYTVHQKLLEILPEKSMPKVQVLPLLASARDADRMMEIIRTWQPHTVYHAAAYKHVPMVEHNPAEGVKNNVLGTWTTARAAAAHGVSDFVLISTDKAVRPTNIMGASKRLAETVLQALASQTKPGGTCFSMVRFGNVLGSSGSVVPRFRKQIKDGGPITLTHADITRYFMSIPEAAQLVIQAGAMAQGGDVFVLDMGEPVRIIDMARSMVELSGLTVRDAANPEGDIEIKITGLRPGEKLYEELLIGDNPLPTQHSRIMKAHEQFVPWPELSARLNDLTAALNANDVPLLRGLLKQLVPGYQPDGEVVDWVHLAQQTCHLQAAVASQQTELIPSEADQ
ncbi:MAG: polysaccharide biosynthesis protein [Rhodoferax sp.]|uniref:polysaccharide biosynthesis protein n=1 Tax=Rhodoferax sp. TaxID=50421 RepID=UPI0014019370|nr:nucleoside-diphosphate sugar epimerase/dehydratase [Rhodoferax sp.]NDP38895.1 polysaccharide biosynthesis protein [Rhodoferax sp.]